jgi:hypothetical protein
VDECKPLARGRDGTARARPSLVVRAEDDPLKVRGGQGGGIRVLPWTPGRIFLLCSLTGHRAKAWCLLTNFIHTRTIVSHSRAPGRKPAAAGAYR